MTHRAEIERWAKCPDGTRVYKKLDQGFWVLEIKTEWLPEETYVVDDAYERVRRYLIDYGFIWFNSSLHGWVKVNNIYDINPADKYAVAKPEAKPIPNSMFDATEANNKQLLREAQGFNVRVTSAAFNYDTKEETKIAEYDVVAFADDEGDSASLPEKTTLEKHDADMAEYLISKMTGDPEGDHAMAEHVLLKLLADMGYVKLVEAFRNEAYRFWYA